MKREVVLFFAIFGTMPAVAGDTELSLYRPLTETDTHPAVERVIKKNGQCLTQSERIKREDAWHCEAEGIVYDPCFVAPYGSHLEAICPESPWSHQGVQISVASPLDNSNHQTLDMSRTYPWAIELTNGEKCEAVVTTKEYDGLPVRYRCEKQSELIGHVQRCNSTWKILQHAANGVDTVEIAKAWF